MTALFKSLIASIAEWSRTRRGSICEFYLPESNCSSHDGGANKRGLTKRCGYPRIWS